MTIVYRATIIHKGIELLSGVYVRIEETDIGSTSWRRSFETDDHVFLDMAGELCTIKLDDGRSGDIIIHTPPTTTLTPSYRIAFQGSGGLSKDDN